mmetsp:Transcript_47090/g.138916  ORF Transcript_47090/g.138916 Transcript_47090/m.138916 type:complete len:221 (-) Transcript_47090:450-1112(-)
MASASNGLKGDIRTCIQSEEAMVPHKRQPSIELAGEDARIASIGRSAVDAPRRRQARDHCSPRHRPTNWIPRQPMASREPNADSWSVRTVVRFCTLIGSKALVSAWFPALELHAHGACCERCRVSEALANTIPANCSPPKFGSARNLAAFACPNESLVAPGCTTAHGTASALGNEALFAAEHGILVTTKSKHCDIVHKHFLLPPGDAQHLAIGMEVTPVG